MIMHRHSLRRRYGRARKRGREFDVVQRAATQLIMGKRLEVHGKAGLIFYMGSSKVDRRDPYWYEGPGGRTYKERPEEVVRAILPHVGFDAIDHAQVYAS
jgi:hypothetical protein